MKVGIITMHRVTNFGSALQVYGLLKAIQDLGYDSQIIDYRFPNSFRKGKTEKKRFSKYFKQKNLFKAVVNKLRTKVFDVWKQQIALFEDFYDHYYQVTEPYYEREDIVSNPPLFDILVTGSDQVWNTKHTFGDPTFFCDFAGNIPRISFGSSFSTKEVDPIYKEQFKNFLNAYTSISVREQNGIKIVKELTGKDADMVCDPSMLLDKDHYRTISRKPNVELNKPYILAYILDYNFNPYPLIKDLLNRLSAEKGLPIIFLQCGSIQGNSKKDNKQIFDVGPLEFLWLVDNAEFVVTSSFHGAVFSILFEKEYYTVYDEESQDDRLISLSQTLNLQSRLINRHQDVNNIPNTTIDWVEVGKHLSNLRTHSFNFLKTSLEKCRNNA